MELNQRERTFVGVPSEFYNPDRVTVLNSGNIVMFATSAKVLVAKTTDDFFAEAGQAFCLIRDVMNEVNSCKIYTSLDLELVCEHDNPTLKDVIKTLESKFNVIALLDIDTSKHKSKLEAIFRKWFEGGRSLILLYPHDLRKLEGYSEWFVDLLRKKSEWE